MWNALKNTLVRSTQAMARGFLWWCEKFGENRGFARDPGFVAWPALAHLHKSADESELPAGELVRSRDRDGGGKSDAHPHPLSRRAVIISVRRMSIRRSLSALHRPAFVSVRHARQYTTRGNRWDFGA